MRVAALAGAVLALFGSTSAAGAARFVVSYVGSGSYRTIYHSEPPNPGGAHDTNDAHDSSTQRWNLTFSEPLSVTGARRTRALSGATGSEWATGQISHSHVDGLFAADDAHLSCHVRSQTKPAARLNVSIRAGYVGNSVTIVVGNPVADALALLPTACPGQGDSLDGLLDSYYAPGFSFATGYGPAVWFQTAKVVIPVAALERRSSFSVKVRSTAANAPPTDCAVREPAIERCSTGGAWAGVLSFREHH
jgi:hypothetical protein